MALFGAIGAVAGVLNKGLEIITGAIRKQERRDDMQDGARISRADQLEAENAKLREDLANASKPSDPAAAKLRLRERLRFRATRPN